MHGWDNQLTAESYDTYAKTFSTYKETSRDLVRLAEFTEDMQIVDLACGTGMTALAILQVLSMAGHIFAVDASPAMIQVARKNIDAKNISFHLSTAESVHDVIPHNVDRILCNSAFWQMDADKTLQSVRNILKPDGRFLFNLPSMPPMEEGKQDETINLRTLMRQIAEEEYGYKFESTYTGKFPLNSDCAHISQLLGKHDYQVIRHEILTYPETESASRAFFAIPIMTEKALPGIDYKIRMEILDKALARFDSASDDDKMVAWEYYVAAMK